jgi:NADP-dependent 3-hydroxy acid dehydrogenase YdfG
VVSEAFNGNLDILIANAGYLESWKPLAESDPVDWWKTWEVNIKGTYLTCRAFLPLLLQSKLKTAVLVSSVGAHKCNDGASSYQTTKFATCRLTEFLDSEYSSRGLLAFAIHPGGVKTELASNMPEALHSFLIDEPDLPADTLLWLTKERREWLAGRFVSCNWDMERLEKKQEDVVSRNLFKFVMKA